MTREEYRVAQVQQARVTYENGRWVGSIAPSAGDPTRALDSCPQVWDYLNRVGAEGWLLVTSSVVVIAGGDSLERLYLRRNP